MVLTKNEMIIFQLLLANREKIVSRDEIMTDLWDNDEFVNDNALTVNISRLRGKLADLGYDDAIFWLPSMRLSTAAILSRSIVGLYGFVI